MKIKLENRRHMKAVQDIYGIFDDIDKLEFTDSSNVITDSYVDFGERIYYEDKLSLKRILYGYFSKKFNKKSPWGIITGTKPGKLYRKYDRNYLAENYLISADKLDLMDEIWKNQELFSFSKDNIHIYINIPFCPSRCSYCSFPTIIYKNKDRRAEYLAYLIKEIKGLAAYINKYKIRSIYIGGGTPSSLEYEDLKILLDTIRDSFDLTNLYEYTIEAGREDCLDLDKLELFKQYSVTRISINPQTFNQKTIRAIGRKQDNKRLVALYHRARDMGFIVNMDLILGLVDEDFEDVKKTLAIIGDLRPQNLSIHTLSLKKGSILFDKLDGSKLDRDLEDIVDYSQDFARSKGYLPYYLYRQKRISSNLENIGYSQEGYFCLYNIVTNEEVENIIGLGMTANSKIFKKDRLVKYTNYKNMDDYIDQLDRTIHEKRDLLLKED